MSSNVLNKFPKETILKALESNWLVRRELNNIIDCCYEIEIGELNEKIEKFIKSPFEDPITEDKLQEYRSKAEKYSEKLSKLYKGQKNHYNSMINSKIE